MPDEDAMDLPEIFQAIALISVVVLCLLVAAMARTNAKQR